LRDNVETQNVERAAPLQPQPQLPWTLISDEVIDVTFLVTTRSERSNNNKLFVEVRSQTEEHTHSTPRMLALTSATGKLGGAVLNAILDNKLIDPKELVVCVRLSLPISTLQFPILHN